MRGLRFINYLEEKHKELLEYIIDGDRLRDVITKVDVTSRTI